MGRTLYWDTSEAPPLHIERGETLVVRVIMDEGLHAFGPVHGRFREDVDAEDADDVDPY